MDKSTPPIQTTRTLIKSLVAALSLAIVVFVTIVLPAEYNIDPTGIGARLGLTVLATAATEPTPAVFTAANASAREDQTTVTIPANNGVEYKFHLPQYGKLSYEWSSAANVLYFDLHGEPDGNTTGYFESYASANGSEMKGSLTAPFAGAHGWYWSNSSNADVIVTLKTQGDYTIIGLK